MLAEELSVVDADASLWQRARPLLLVVQEMEQGDENFAWHGWRKQSIDAFLKGLPQHCTLVVGVWDVHEEQEVLVLGLVCEVLSGNVCSVRTFAALPQHELPPLDQLEPGFEHAREVMHAVKGQVAPVAWALFTDNSTWEEWLVTENNDGGITDKGALLASFARQGRCVLMGSQTLHHYP